MRTLLQKPTIICVETIAKSRLFNIESVDLMFSNGARRIYERMCPSKHDAVIIVPIANNHLTLIYEYAVGTESYELSFPKGSIDSDETVFAAANRELKEEIGFGARNLTLIKQLNIIPSYFSSKINIIIAENLYSSSLEGDEPEPLSKIVWPLTHLMSLLEEPSFNEARNISTLFLVREWLQDHGRL